MFYLVKSIFQPGTEALLDKCGAKNFHRDTGTAVAKYWQLENDKHKCAHRQKYTE